MRCNRREQATQEGAVSQSPQEDPTGAVHVSVHSEIGVIPNCLGTAQLSVHGAVPAAGLAGVRLVGVNMACDMVALGDMYDVAVIFSGDQDYVPAVRIVKDAGRMVVNVAFQTRSGEL